MHYRQNSNRHNNIGVSKIFLLYTHIIYIYEVNVCLYSIYIYKYIKSMYRIHNLQLRRKKTHKLQYTKNQYAMQTKSLFHILFSLPDFNAIGHLSKNSQGWIGITCQN